MQSNEKDQVLTNWAPEVVSLAKDDDVMLGAVIQHSPKAVQNEEQKRFDF